jgi:Rrf2 family transcriptional regulator, cysteine metabolism repressor
VVEVRTDLGSPRSGAPRGVVDAPGPLRLDSYPTKSLGYEDRSLTVPSLPRPTYHGSGAVAFSTKGEYGVRLMVQLARHHGTGPASLAGIAAEEDLPRAYLEQLVVNLREAGLVTSTRGAHGGYELSRDPSTIAMGEVLRALEGPIAPMICASEDPEHATTCDRSARCTVNVLWVRVRDAVTGALDSMTLADLVPPKVPVALDDRQGATTPS